MFSSLLSCNFDAANKSKKQTFIYLPYEDKGSTLALQKYAYEHAYNSHEGVMVVQWLG